MGLRIAIFGQAPFGREVTERLVRAGHVIVGVYAPPDKGRPDPLAMLAEEQGFVLHRYARFRKQGVAIPERVDEYKALGAELNVLPFTTAILPPEIVDPPRLGSLCFHPSLLPAYRGGAALAWQIILGEKETGVTVFRVDQGVDTGPIIVQKGGVSLADTDTTASLYFDKLYELGVEAMVEAVAGVESGSLTGRVQTEAGASFQGLVDDEVARIDWTRPAVEVDRLIRGCTPGPGAIAMHDGDIVRLFGCSLRPAADGEPAGSVLGFEEGSVVIAASGGLLVVPKVRVGSGAKLEGNAAGLSPGDVLA
jgi:methionyl-tRNA formyltransferase